MKKGWGDTNTPRRLTPQYAEGLAKHMARVMAQPHSGRSPVMPNEEECLAATSGALRIPNRNAFNCIQRFKIWRGSNFWGEWHMHLSVDHRRTGFRYSVFSYRRSWPLLIFDVDALVWCANMDKFSKSTTCHMQHARPEWFRPIWMDASTIERVHQLGYIDAMARRIENA